MARYRIVCTKQEPCQVSKDRAHIVAVGTASSGTTYDKYWLLSEVLAAIDDKDKFYTLGETSKKEAAVDKYKCPWCEKMHIKSAADAVKDNNLDNLPTC